MADHLAGLIPAGILRLSLPPSSPTSPDLAPLPASQSWRSWDSASLARFLFPPPPCTYTSEPGPSTPKPSPPPQDSQRLDTTTTHSGEDPLSTSFSFLRTLDDLVRAGILHLTHRFAHPPSPPLLLLRVYLVPSDARRATVTGTSPKGKSKAGVRAELGSVLERLECGADAWHGRLGSGTARPFWDEEQDHRSLAEMYQELPSPQIDERLQSASSPRVRRVLDMVQRNGRIPGLKSRLYPYQTRSLWRLLQRELAPTLVNDPWLVPMRYGDGSAGIFYADLDARQFFREAARFAEGKGGILCEEMGCGKTCISLALILATRDQLPEVSGDPRATIVFTDLSLSTFPSSQTLSLFRDPCGDDLPDRRFCDLDSSPPVVVQDDQLELEQERDDADGMTPLASGITHRPDGPPRAGLPSLVDLCVHRVRTDSINFRESDGLGAHLRRALSSNPPFYLLYPPPPSRRHREAASRSPRRIHLSPATLVCVPPTLLIQWRDEIKKHVAFEDGGEGGLRVLVLGKTSQEIPAPDRLAQEWDVVLISHNRLGREEADGRLEDTQIGVPRACRCPYVGATRVRRCVCPNRSERRISPLMLVHWKRLIIDEGNVMSGRSSLVRLAEQLRVERRWIVSGTPTPGLLGLNIGVGHMAAAEGPMENRGDHDRWTPQDERDLERLGKLFTTFLQLPPFYRGRNASTRNWKTHVMQPLLNPTGPEFGATRRIDALMRRLMIRNRAEDVERDVSLPPLEHKVRLLDFAPLERKTFNAAQALLAANAVLSQRVDQDYIFHPSNKHNLRVVARNLTEACFFFFGKDMVHQIEESIKIAKDGLDKADERGYSLEDRELLRGAYRHLRMAFEDRFWIRVMLAGNLHYFSPHLPSELARSWDGFVNNTPTVAFGDLAPSESAMQAEAIVEMRKGLDTSIGQGVMDDEELWEELYTHGERWKRKKFVEAVRSDRSARSKATARKAAAGGGAGAEAEEKENLSAVIALAHTTDKSHAKELDQLQRKVRDEEARRHRLADHLMEAGEKGDAIRALFGNAHRPTSRLPSSSGLAECTITGTTSIKLQAIIDEVLSHPDDKFLIFTSQDNVVFFVGEALDLVGVENLMFVSHGLNAEKRAVYAETFQSSARFRVMIMDVALAGRGLDLHAASRVIFVEPCWQHDLEAQAIKRSHRIGQQRPVSALTLAVRGTSEEFMLQRRRELSRSLVSLTKSMEDDWKMADFIKTPAFLTASDSSSPERHPSFKHRIPLFPAKEEADWNGEADDVTLIGSRVAVVKDEPVDVELDELDELEPVVTAIPESEEEDELDELDEQVPWADRRRPTGVAATASTNNVPVLRAVPFPSVKREDEDDVVEETDSQVCVDELASPSSRSPAAPRTAKVNGIRREAVTVLSPPPCSRSVAPSHHRRQSNMGDDCPGGDDGGGREENVKRRRLGFAAA